MFKFTKQNYFRWLAVLTFGSVYLTVVFYRFPAPFHTPTLYLLIWLLSLIVFQPSFFNSKFAVPIFLFAGIFALGYLTIWSDNPQIPWIHVRGDFFWMSLTVMMYYYFLHSNDLKGFAMTSLLAAIFIVLQSGTSVIGLTLYPGAARQLALADPDITAVNLKEIGIGTFGFFASLIFVFPALIIFLKTFRSIFYRVALILSIAIMFYSIILSNFTTTILLAGLVIVFSLISNKNIKASFFLLISLSFITLFIFQTEIASFFYFISNLFPDTILERRFADVGDTIIISGSSVIQGQTYATDVRLGLAMDSLFSFFRNPIYGAGELGGHAYFLDRLGIFGLLGFLPWIYFFKIIVSSIFKMARSNYQIYYLISFMAYILFGLTKNGLGNPEVMLSVFFITPGLLLFLQMKKHT